MKTKTCRECDQDKPIEQFRFRDRARGIRHNICIDCANVYGREHYRLHRETYIAQTVIRNKRLRARNFRFLFKYLSQHPCKDCGESNPMLLEFHHLRDKIMEVSNMVTGYSIAAIMNEIAKCVVLCANCHKLRTYIQYGGHPFQKLGLM